MSKESSIKVYAENFSGSDKPVNAIPVWIENASAISGGGGGGSIPSDVSGKWENASDCVQTNSGTWSQGGGSDLSAYTNSSFNLKNPDGYATCISADTDNTSPNLVLKGSSMFTPTGWSTAPANITLNDVTINDGIIKDLTATKDVIYWNSASWNDTKQVVQTNSAQWAQGGGSDTPELLDVVFHYNYGSYNNGEIINNTQSAIDVKFNLQTHYIPSDLIIDGSPYTWNQDPDNPNYYIISTNIYPGMSMRGIPLYYSNDNTNYDSIIINNTYSGKFGNRTLTLYGKNAYFSGGYAYPYDIRKVSQGSMQPQLLTSFNGNFSYSAMTNDAIYIEVYGQDDGGIPYDTYGSFISSPESTVTSGDVFPPTTGLTQGSKYYLAWNTNNGGLYWEYVGN